MNCNLLYYIMENRNLNRQYIHRHWKFSSIQPLTHQQPPLFLLCTPFMVTAVAPTQVTWHGQVGETYVGHPFPLSSPLFGLSECQTPLHTYYFYGCGRVHCWNVLRVCNSYCVSDPLHWWNSIDINFSLLLQSLLVALWQLKIPTRYKSSTLSLKYRFQNICSSDQGIYFKNVTRTRIRS